MAELCHVLQAEVELALFCCGHPAPAVFPVQGDSITAAVHSSIYAL